MNRWRNWPKKALYALILVACEPGGPTDPEPIEVPVQLVAPKGVTIAGPIRIAVVWRLGSDERPNWLSTFDEELPNLSATTNVWFDLPTRAERPALKDVSLAYLACDEENEILVGGPVAIPRLVAYQDLDGSGDFDPDLPLNPGSDQVLAVTPSANSNQYIAAFTDLDGVLSRVPMEYAECVRAFTSDRYSAFLAVSQHSDYVWAQPGPLSARLDLAPNRFAAVAMGCSSSDVFALSNQSSLVTQSQSSRVDVRIDPSPCINAPWQCSRLEVESLGLPTQPANLSYPGFSHSYICTAVGDFDVLWLTENTIDCEGCKCDWLQTRQSWVVHATRPPADWPCGSTVRYCGARRASIWEIPSYCGLTSLVRPD